MYLDWIFLVFSNFIFMQFFGLFALIFGWVIIAFPEFLAYIIGFFFVFIGFNILIIGSLFQKKNGSSNQSEWWKVGGYEILRNKK